MSGEFAWSAAIGLLFAAASIVIVLGTYALSRRLLHSGDEDRSHDVATSVAGRIVTLYGLILALVYAQELDDYKGVRTILMEESVAVSDVFNDIRRYGGPDVAPVQHALAIYLKTVVDEEWERLGRREGLSPKAWSEWETVYNRLLDLSPANDRQRSLAQRMRDRITAVARFRQLRASTAMGGFGGVFWAPAVLGLSLLAIPFYVYRPTRSHVFLLGVFGLYSGVILFFIYAFSNPFKPPGKLEPAPFQQLLQGEVGRSLSVPN